MDARIKKLMKVYEIETSEAQDLVSAGLDTPRKIKAGLEESKLPKVLKDKARK